MKIIDLFEELVKLKNSHYNNKIYPRINVIWLGKWKNFKITDIYTTDEALILESDLSARNNVYHTVDSIYKAIRDIIITENCYKDVLIKVREATDLYSTVSIYEYKLKDCYFRNACVLSNSRRTVFREYMSFTGDVETLNMRVF